MKVPRHRPSRSPICSLPQDHHRLSEAHDPALAAEHKELDERIAQLWEEHRVERARLRFGERDEIIHRARAEERLDRAA